MSVVDNNEELEQLEKTKKSLGGVLTTFDMYRGENPQLDLLLKMLAITLNKSLCPPLSSAGEGFEQVQVERNEDRIDKTEISLVLVSDENKESLGTLRKIMKSLHGLATTFDLYRGENSRLDVLLEMLDMILSKPSPSATSSLALDGEHLNEMDTAANYTKSSPGSLNLSEPQPECSRPCSSTKRKASSINMEMIEAGHTSKKYRENCTEFDTQLGESLTPRNHPIFSIELVMLKILNKLSNQQLLSCRRTNSSFNYFVKQVLSRRECFTVRFIFDWPSMKYGTVKYNKVVSYRREEFTLQHFTRFVQMYPDFFCGSFSFHGGNLSAEDLQEFLSSSHGVQIKRIFIDLFDPPKQYVGITNPLSGDPPTIYLLRKLLTEQLPQLTSLELSRVPFKWSTTPHQLFPEPKGMEVYAPNLKFLRLCRQFPEKIFGNIVKAAINLQEISGYPNLPELLKENKFHLVKSLVWSPEPEDEYTYKNYHITRSQLMVLDVSFKHMYQQDGLWPSLSKVLQNILETSCTTFKKIEMNSSIGFLPDFEIPELAKVNELRVHLRDKYYFFQTETNRIFPPGFQFTKSFPNLSIVHFGFPHLKKTGCWEEYFGTNLQPASSVKTFYMEHTKYVPHGWMNHFAQLFPNLESLDVRCQYFNFMEAAQSGWWSFPRLKRLTCGINMASPEISHPALEIAFTGFSLETVLSLQESSATVDISTIEYLREHSSILDLKDLKTLRLKFIDYSQEVRPSYPSILTHVTGIFAFQMCPGLQIFLDYTLKEDQNLKMLKESLSPLFPYVTSCNGERW